MKFTRAPLIELIADFRWVPTSAMGEPIADPNTLGISSPQTELFYDKLRASLASIGFTSSERLVPQGMPYPLYQPLVRYRRATEEEANVIFQVGLGTFSVHALPPYDNWEHFQPIIATGLHQLVQTRLATAPFQTVFTRVALRYVNAFQPAIFGGRSRNDFLRDVLGLRVDLPDSIQDQIGNYDSLHLGVNARVRVSEELELGISVGENARVPGALIMDLGAQCERQLPWSEADPLEILSNAHAVIRKAFVGMTRLIHEDMGYEEESE